MKLAEGYEVELGRLLPEVIDLRAKILRPGLDRSTASFAGDEDPEAIHAIVRYRSRVIGVGSLVPEPYEHRPALRLRGMAVEDDFRGQGVGSTVLEALLGFSQAPNSPGSGLVWCLARVRARSLYERYGFVVDGDAFEIEPIGVHVRMPR